MIPASAVSEQRSHVQSPHRHSFCMSILFFITLFRIIIRDLSTPSPSCPYHCIDWRIQTNPSPNTITAYFYEMDFLRTATSRNREWRPRLILGNSDSALLFPLNPNISKSALCLAVPCDLTILSSHSQRVSFTTPTLKLETAQSQRPRD